MLSYRGSSRPKDQIHVFCISSIADRFFITEPLGKPLPVRGFNQINLEENLSIDNFIVEEKLLWTPSATAATATAKSLQSCLTLCDSIDSSPPDSPIPGILQARTLEWVAISFSNA